MVALLMALLLTAPVVAFSESTTQPTRHYADLRIGDRASVRLEDFCTASSVGTSGVRLKAGAAISVLPDSEGHLIVKRVRGGVDVILHIVRAVQGTDDALAILNDTLFRLGRTPACEESIDVWPMISIGEEHLRPSVKNGQVQFSYDGLQQ